MKKVFLNSLPKAGTNLLARALELLGYAQTGTMDASLVLSSSFESKVRRLLSWSLRQGCLVGIDMPVEVSSAFVDRVLRGASENCFVAGHVGYTADLLERVKRMDFAPVVMLRDPRAVLSSFVHYVSENSDHPLHPDFSRMSMEDRYRYGLQGCLLKKVTLQPLVIRCRALQPWVDDPAVLCLRFEDLVGPRGGGDESAQKEALVNLAGFLGGDIGVVDSLADQVFGPGRHTFRKGKVDAWRDEIPASVLDEVDGAIAPILRDWGYAR